VPHDVRDEVVDFVNRWSERSELTVSRFITWLAISRSKFYDWQRRYGRVNEHNRWVPRDFWLEPEEKQAIVKFHDDHPLEGYRRLTFMMLDRDVVAVSPSTTYRVLKEAGVLHCNTGAPSKKGTGFQQPLRPHEHWHVDISHLNIAGTFYYLCSILDGYSRYVVHWEIREAMKEHNVEMIVQRAREKFPEAHPRVISDNGPQFVAKDFKEFIRLCGMSHVRTSPFYPQSNGKWERWARSLKHECVRPKTPLSVHHARTIVGGWVNYYCDERLHSALGYIAPKDKLEGREKTIFAERDRKLEQARERRKLKRQEAHEKEATIGKTILTSETIGNTTCSAGETDAGSAGAQPARDTRPGRRGTTSQRAALGRCSLPPTSLLEPRMPQNTQLPLTEEYPLSPQACLSISG
jgi:transposase InsO family protein